jgi:GT2 family glycosyltransferase
MVISIRQSLAGVYGLTYEVVLVDGGSNDTTQDWCKQQPDIRLIEHGELKGAVKAFNDGAYAAQGKYVIMANDDIEFVDNSILTAYVYMETHPNCGGGCFYQDTVGIVKLNEYTSIMLRWGYSPNGWGTRWDGGVMNWNTGNI